MLWRMQRGAKMLRGGGLGPPRGAPLGMFASYAPLVMFASYNPKIRGHALTGVRLLGL